MKFLNKQHIFYQSGFTLIELIIVIAVIALLAASVFVAVDPAKRIGQAQDAQRWSDVTAIAEAIQLYKADHGGEFPTSTSDGVFTMYGLGSLTRYYLLGIGTVSNNDLDSDNCANYPGSLEPEGVLLSNLVPTYLPTMPVDPTGLQNNGRTTGYYIRFLNSPTKFEIGVCEESDYATASIYVQR
ncbi:type II secretion system protein [Patescibacteria group bacterium]|nr:type II secretion system protein [Patescibacteria group bacterium]